MNRQFILPAIFTIMVIGMTIFPDRNEVFGTNNIEGETSLAVASASAVDN
ncbi:MAG: hypothetical protein AAGK17_12110 [Pseudomonadota bacterium]